SNHLPRMDELRDAPTRPLRPFEKQALAALYEGEELRTETTTNRISMLGAIRALKACLACHQVERGDRLGAFSYTLLREPTRPCGRGRRGCCRDRGKIANAGSSQIRVLEGGVGLDR